MASDGRRGKEAVSREKKMKRYKVLLQVIASRYRESNRWKWAAGERTRRSMSG
jgi:hypothetical protein